MKPNVAPMILALLSTGQGAAGAAEQDVAFPAACASLTSIEITPDQLATRVAGAQSARLALPRDANAPASRQCESVVLRSFERLGKIKTQAAAEAVTTLVLNRRLQLDSADRSAIASHIIEGGLGPLVGPLLYPHRDESILAREIVSCIGQKTCM